MIKYYKEELAEWKWLQNYCKKHGDTGLIYQEITRHGIKNCLDNLRRINAQRIMLEVDLVE